MPIAYLELLVASVRSFPFLWFEVLNIILVTAEISPGTPSEGLRSGFSRMVVYHRQDLVVLVLVFRMVFGSIQGSGLSLNRLL